MTLVEMVVAMGVGCMLLLFVTNFLITQRRATRRGEARIDRGRHARAVVRFLSDRLKAVTPPFRVDGSGRLLLYGEQWNAPASNRVRLEDRDGDRGNGAEALVYYTYGSAVGRQRQENRIYCREGRIIHEVVGGEESLIGRDIRSVRFHRMSGDPRLLQVVLAFAEEAGTRSLDLTMRLETELACFQ